MITVLAGSVVLLGVVVAGLWRWQDGRAGEDEIVLYGNIDIREADLAFNIAGRVASMEVEEGDHVRTGQLLARLEDESYRAEVDAAKARISAQQAVLDRLLAGSRPEEIKRAEAEVDAIAAQLNDARIQLKRTEKLTKDDFASQQTLDSARALVSRLEAELNAAKQALELAIQGPRQEDIAEARASLKVRQAELALAEEHLNWTRLYAKQDGVVKTRIVEPGAVVLPQSPAYTIAISSPVWVRTFVSETDLGHVKPGMKALVFTDSAPDKAHEGWVGYVSPVAEFTPKTVETREVRTSLVYRLRVYVDNPDDDLRQGMPVTVRLKRSDRTAQLTPSIADGS